MFKSLSSAWESATFDAGYECSMAQRASALRFNEIRLHFFLTDLWRSLLCRLRDHEWVNDGCDGENGTEDFFCGRCGERWHVQY